MKLIDKSKFILDDGAKLNDICIHEDGRHSQIVEIKDGVFVCGFYCRFPYEISFNSCGIYNHDNSKSDYDIVGYEPLASEGSFDWSIQMMKLGLSITINGDNVGYRINMHNDRIIESYNFAMPISHSLEDWTDRFKFMKNWKLYKPLLLDAKIGYICEREDGECVQISKVIFDNCDRCFIADSTRYDIHGKSDNGNLLNLISCEPFSIKKAVQMIKSGKRVFHPYCHDKSMTLDDLCPFQRGHS